LAETLERSHAASARLTVVELRSDPWPWQHRCPSDDEETCTSLSQFGADPDPEALDYAAPLVSIVIPHFNLGSYLCETLDSVIAMTYRNIEIVVVNDASTDRSSVEIIDKLGLIDEARFQVVQPSGNVGLAAARNLGIRHARGRYVLTLDADDLIDPAFVSKAVHALERHPEFDLVVTPAAYFNDGEDISTLDCTEAMAYGIFTGEARIAGLLENRFSTATALFRKTVLERFPYNEDLHCYEDWSLYMRMCDAGVRCIVTTGVYFFYRRRADSMLNRPRSGSIRHLEYADMLRTSASPALRVGSRHLVLGLPACVAESARRHAAASPDVEAMLQRVLSSESSLRAVYRCLAPVAKVFRLLRFVWNRMLPLRRKMVHARGRLSRTFKYRA
ncbi:MAG: glycosyltransferase family 2 protein, partial [Janthinobacterium lividum]